MGIEATKHQIGAHQYTVTTFSAPAAIKLWTRIVRLIGPAAGEIFGEADNKAATMGDLSAQLKNTSSSAVARAVKTLTEQLADEVLLTLIKDILSSTHVDVQATNGTVTRPTAEVFDQHFAGPKMLAELIKVVTKVLEVNFSDFLSELQQSFGSLMPSSPPTPGN